MELTLLILLQVIFLDICLSGDNAVVIGLAANGLPARLRDRAIALGIGGAILIRLLLLAVAATLLANTYVGMLGGVLLLWVALNMWREIQASAEDDPAEAAHSEKTLWRALAQILIADVSMSLDNILAVGATARDHIGIMIFGVVLSMVLLGFAAKGVAQLLTRWTWLSYVGLALIVYVALQMLARGLPAIHIPL